MRGTDKPHSETPVPKGLARTGVIAYIAPGSDTEPDLGTTDVVIEAAFDGLGVPEPHTARIRRRYKRAGRSDEVELCVPSFLLRVFHRRSLYEIGDRTALFRGCAQLHLAGRDAAIATVCEILEMAHDPRRPSGDAAAPALAALAELLR